jgi:DNA invertase Pin-like site-specific DNA recombinase
MRVAIYARVSTMDQSTAMQSDELREYCQRRGWTVVAEYVDHGVSGSKDSRPELDKMLLAAKRREFDCLLFWKLDRLGRSLKHLVNTIADLEALGISFASLKDSLDLSTPSGRLMFGVIAAMAQFERDLIRERVLSGLAAAKRRGRVGGRRAKVTDLTMREIQYLRGQGLSLAAIGQRLALNKATVSRALRGMQSI